MKKRIALVILLVVATGVVIWAVVRFVGARRNRLTQSASESSNAAPRVTAEAWAAAVERVKEDRGEAAGGAIEIPPELKHYSERYWFLATQVAEIEKYKVNTCQDYLDLAAMIERGEMVAVPTVTDTYVLYGVGQKADESAFSRYKDEHSIELYNETQLADAYRKLDDEDKALLDQVYGQPDARQKLLREYQSLQTLANNFFGRSYNIDNPHDRQELKINMLRSLRPEALKILETVASAYQRQFNRPLPVSSLVRPEQYQRALNRVNRNAVLIDTPPHSTGLAFDIDYRYMSGTEQTFVMRELARLKNEGRIEVIRERNANYHIFAFMNGARPGDDLIAASLEKAGAPVETEAHHTPVKTAKVKRKAAKVRPRTVVRKKRRR